MSYVRKQRRVEPRFTFDDSPMFGGTQIDEAVIPNELNKLRLKQDFGLDLLIK